MQWFNKMFYKFKINKIHFWEINSFKIIKLNGHLSTKHKYNQIQHFRHCLAFGFCIKTAVHNLMFAKQRTQTQRLSLKS